MDGSEPGAGGPPSRGVRAGDADRVRAEAVLREASAAGRIGLDDLEGRIAVVQRAVTQDEVAGACAGLAPVLPPPPPRPPAGARGDDGTATAAIVCGVGGLVLPVPLLPLAAVVLGLVARSRIGGPGRDGWGRATAGLALGAVMTVAQVVLVALFAAGVIG